MSKKLPLTKRLWVADAGSIYTADTEEMTVDFDKKRIQVRRSIASNVGESLAEHIVHLHNQTIMMDRCSEFISGSPERFKFHDFGPRGNTEE